MNEYLAYIELTNGIVGEIKIKADSRSEAYDLIVQSFGSVLLEVRFLN